MLKDLAKKHDRELVIQPYGREINRETYVYLHIRNAPKGREGYADQTVSGTERSTLSRDAFAPQELDSMLANRSEYGDFEIMEASTIMLRPKQR